MCYIKHFLTLQNSTFLISYSASVVTSTTRDLIGMNQNHTWEVHLKGPALTYVQSIFLPAFSYELCSYTSICFHSILSETFMMLSNTNFKCHILCMKCFMQNMLYVIVKSQISIGFQQFHQHLNIYRPFLNSMVIEMLNLLIEWHITSFTRKIVFQLLHLFLLRNTYYKHDFLAAVMKLMKTRYTSDFYFCPSFLMCYLNYYLFPIKNHKSQSLRSFKNNRKSHSRSPTNFSEFVPVIQEESKVPILPRRRKNYGGSRPPIILYKFLEPYFSANTRSKLDPSAEFQTILEY